MINDCVDVKAVGVLQGGGLPVHVSEATNDAVSSVIQHVVNNNPLLFQKFPTGKHEQDSIKRNLTALLSEELGTGLAVKDLAVGLNHNTLSYTVYVNYIAFKEVEVKQNPDVFEAFDEFCGVSEKNNDLKAFKRLMEKDHIKQEVNNLFQTWLKNTQEQLNNYTESRKEQFERMKRIAGI